MTAEVTDLARVRRSAQMARALASVAAEMARQSLTVELAVEREDWDTAHEAAERLIELWPQFRELRRGLLAIGRR